MAIGGLLLGMLKKIISLFPILAIAALVLSVSPVLAKNDKNSDDEWVIPEQNGTYDVPGHPNLKVRVFVHNPKPPKPEPTPAPALVCGLNDPDSTAVVDSAGWHLPQNWTYQLNPTSVPASVGSANLAIMAKDAFGRWTAASGNKVNFTKGANTGVAKAGYDHKNIIAWGKAPASALGVTYTWYYTATKEVAEVDTIMNVKFPWSWTPYNSQNLCADKNSYDAQDILTHELGHWIGLDDEYTEEYVNNTMYGYGSKGETDKDTLTTGDIAGVDAIY